MQRRAMLGAGFAGKADAGHGSALHVAGPGLWQG